MSDTNPPTTDTARTTATDTDADADVSLKVDSITKIFDDGSEDGVLAVDDISMDIEEGEFVVLVGPSGCGKTTTLRTIAGLEEPTDGNIIIEGENVLGQEPRERDIAMVFQNYALYPHKTIRENIGFPLEIRGYPEDEIEQRVRETAELLDIPELLDRRPSDLSGGQQQRVALGRAIVRDPEVFLFDEPLSNLDAKLRVEMRTELNKLHDEVGKTSVYVTHDQAEAMTLSDRVAVMNDGRLQQIAPPQEVYANPTNRFVAGFIGEPPMNFFDAEVVSDPNGHRVVGEFFDLKLPEPLAESVETWDGNPANVEVGIRPDHFEDINYSREVPGNEQIEASVKVVEPMGSHIDLTLAPVGQEDDEDAEFTARVTNDTDASEGDQITLAVDVRSLNIFDRDTGNNIVVDD